MKSHFSSVDAETRLRVTVESSQVTVNSKQLFNVCKIDEPHFPHSISLSCSFKRLIPFRGDNSRHVWVEICFVDMNVIGDTYQSWNLLQTFGDGANPHVPMHLYIKAV